MRRWATGRKGPGWYQLLGAQVLRRTDQSGPLEVAPEWLGLGAWLRREGLDLASSRFHRVRGAYSLLLWHFHFEART